MRAALAAALVLAPGAAFAQGTVPCAQERGQQMGSCEVRVERSDGGATVTATFPNGFSRRLSFEGGAFVRANATMSGNGTDTDAALAGGVHVIRVDDQRYEIPAALVAE